jgi:hypothetical protein
MARLYRKMGRDDEADSLLHRAAAIRALRAYPKTH